MERINVYSSAPLSTQLSVAFQGLKVLGMEVWLRPLAELPAGRGRRLSSLRFELLQVSQRLATLGDVLTAHEDGQLRLDACSENGLRAERDALQSRQRAIQATIQAQHDA